jgi:hypothetical protein
MRAGAQEHSPEGLGRFNDEKVEKRLSSKGILHHNSLHLITVQVNEAVLGWLTLIDNVLVDGKIRHAMDNLLRSRIDFKRYIRWS